MKHLDSNFIQTVQRFVARESVGATAVRNQGTGVLHAVHAYLDSLDLSCMRGKDNDEYREWLDQHTEALLEKLPVKNKPWGAARKALNLFMRTALYNRYLSDRFNLGDVEQWMEIPLDSAVARGLKKADEKEELPQWPGLKRLTREASDRFQKVAHEMASRRDISIVHLDMYLWMENR